MKISEVIQDLEHIQSMAGDIQVYGLDEICGDLYLVPSVGISVDGTSEKTAVITFRSASSMLIGGTK